MKLSENQIQRAVFSHLRTRGAPGLVAFHPKNGGVHQIGRRRGINAGLGVLAGVSDVIILHKSRFYALELKAVGGKTSEVQREFGYSVLRAGGESDIVEGLDNALKWLENRGLLIGKKT